jgi:glucokinase
MNLYAGFDMGGTQLKYGLIEKEENIVFEGTVDSPQKTVDLIRLLKSLWGKLKEMEKGTIKAVGFGFPGIFNQEKQQIFQSPNYPDIDNFDLHPAISEFMDVPFTINNDANMAAYGEYMWGAGKNVHSMVLLTLGTGLGTGIILEGKLWQGKCGYGGELGHAVVNPDGDRCGCGSYGCLESEVGAQKIAKNYRGLSGKNENLTPEEIYNRAIRGDKAAEQAFAMVGSSLGKGLSIAINFLNPEKIILGGGVMKAGDFLLKPAIEEARKRSFSGSFECCSIEKAILGNKAGFIGAACYAAHNAG